MLLDQQPAVISRMKTLYCRTALTVEVLDEALRSPDPRRLSHQSHATYFPKAVAMTKTRQRESKPHVDLRALSG